ncbi:MAG: death-on-curing protein [Gottschalkiaceae bacterium]|nr:MAG: death-on-curing protein [Gottschalkiaceae bacterium]
MFKDKYNLSLKQNIFLAKKLIVENIYNSAKLEGCNVTFPDTKTILDGVSVANLKMSDVEVILNLRDAWKYLIDNIDKEFNLDFACKINSFVARNESLEWGVLRYGSVTISGTDYIPPIPIKDDVIKNINDIMNIENVTERAIKYFLWGMRGQLFWDGNKRTSSLCANKILISEGKGILSIQEKDIREFNIRLTEFYNTNDYSKIDKFIYEKCIHGITFQQDQSMDNEDEELEI